MKLLVQLINDVMQESFGNIEKKEAFDDAVKAMDAFREVSRFLEKHYPENVIVIPAEVYNK